MNRTKAKQSSRFEGTLTLPPTRKSKSKRPRSPSPGEESSVNKHQRIQLSNQELDGFFFMSMENRLKNTIRSVVRKNKKTLNNDLEVLKQKLLTAKSLPRGIITDAAKLAETAYNASNQADIILRQMRLFMTNREGKKNEIEWQDYVVNNFDHFRNEEMIRFNSSQMNSEVSPQIYQEPLVEKKEEDAYRTCTVSMNKVIREDLDPSIKNLIFEKLRCSMINSTDYMLYFSSLVQMIFIQLKSTQFYINENIVSTRKVTGFDMTTIIPIEFKKETEKYTIAPLETASALGTDFDQLFQEQHLKLVNTKYFGERGAKEQNLISHPVQNALFKALDDDIKTDLFSTDKVPPTVMDLVLQQYLTNFQNMWSEKVIINKLLDKLLIVLLRLHLAPSREIIRRQNLSKLTSKEPVEKRPSKNYARCILRGEKKKLKRYNHKMKAAEEDIKRHKWSTVIKKAEARINGLRETFSQKRNIIPPTQKELTESPLPSVENISLSEDASKRRINQLKSGIKHLIFTKDTCSKKDVENEFLDATTKEVTTCLLIVNTVKKFIPVKEKYHITAHQIYFCIFANDVLEYAGYSKFTRKLCPSMSISNINALPLDAPSLYQIMNKKLDNYQQTDNESTELIIYGYHKEPISSVEFARRNKDAVFNSLFEEKILKNPYIIREGQESIENLQSELIQLKDEIKQLEKELENTLNYNNENNSVKILKDLRKDWHTTVDKQALYKKIKKEKDSRDDTYGKINKFKNSLRQKKQALYFKQMAIKFKAKIPIAGQLGTSEVLSKNELNEESSGLYRSEMCLLNDPQKYTYSGTDNGIVNMTTTVPFSIERFSFHLKLRNYYSILEEDKNVVPVSDLDLKKFLNIPTATTTQSSDIDIGCGYFKERLKLEKRKKNSLNTSDRK